MSYIFQFEGKAFTPEGQTNADNVAERNRDTERREIEFLKTAPERIMLYVSEPKPLASDSASREYALVTWLGTMVSDWCRVGPKRYVGFGHGTYRRAISARVFGVLYHGWYYASSGDYCRLRKAKVTK